MICIRIHTACLQCRCRCSNDKQLTLAFNLVHCRCQCCIIRHGTRSRCQVLPLQPHSQSGQKKCTPRSYVTVVVIQSLGHGICVFTNMTLIFAVSVFGPSINPTMSIVNREHASKLMMQVFTSCFVRRKRCQTEFADRRLSCLTQRSCLVAMLLIAQGGEGPWFCRPKSSMNGLEYVLQELDYPSWIPSSLQQQEQLSIIWA